MAKSITAPSVPGVPYIIMRYKVSFLGIDQSVWELMVRPVPEGRGNVSLNKKQALELVDKQGLVLLSSDGDNLIYGTPDEAFLRKWKGFFEKERLRIQRKSLMRSEKNGNGLPARKRGRPRLSTTREPARLSL